MEEEKNTETPKKSCNCANDLRTFVIALLTALIVVSFYHLGTRYCRMKAILAQRSAAPKVLTVCPCCRMPGPRMGMPKPGFERGRRFDGQPGERRFDGKPGERRFDGKPGRRHFRPGDQPMLKRGPKPADAPKAPEAPKAQKARAPAPAK